MFMTQLQIAPPEEAASIRDVFHQYHWFHSLLLSLVHCGIDSLQMESPKLLDFGCGAGVHLAQLKQTHPYVQGCGYEPYLPAKIVDEAIPVCSSLVALPQRKWDIVTALEVIEHIEDDLGALKQIHSLLSADGILMISVPAYMHLWSSVDLVSGHYRRYNKKTIKEVVERSGFRVIESFYILPHTYPVFFLRRWLDKVFASVEIKNKYDTFHNRCPKDPLGIPSMLTKLELAMITKTKLRFPFGGGIFLYARKRS